ncbi:hypothetical protein M9Y10_025686 [Tritrichomonas musculus]|uniref:Uncharacterized protein n=1 Tax=Tritrichomonas musculus TaxID=1915356 RepID=A0ABR2H9D0_9EUKA
MNENRYDNRLIRLSDVIRTSIDEMMSERMAQQFQKKKISPTNFSNRLLQVLDIGLKCEREQYIKELLQKLKNVEKERDDLQKELNDQKRRFAHESTIIETDKAALQRKYLALDEHYKTLGWRKDQSEMSYQEKIQMRDNIIRLQRIALNQTQKANNLLQNQVRELKELVISNNKKQTKALKALKATLFDQFHQTMGYFIKKQKKRDNLQLKTLLAEYKNEKMAHDQLKGASQLLLDSIWNISPRRNKPPKFSLEDLPRKVSEVHNFIQHSVQDQKDIAIENVKKELSSTLPEISIIGQESVTEAVTSVITDRVAEKEAEFLSKLKAHEKREEKLKRKLQIALTQIQSLKKPVMSPPQYRYVDEYKEIKDDWDQQKELLDKKMQELSQGISMSLNRSSLSKSIFTSP